jgi:hypothetical protein
MPIAISQNLLYKKTVLYALPKIKAYFSIVQIEEDFMKKLLCVISLVMVALGTVACGNSPDGDKQKLSSSVSPSL